MKSPDPDPKIFELNRQIADLNLKISDLQDYIQTGDVAKYVIINNKIVDSLHTSKSAEVYRVKYAILEKEFEDYKISNQKHEAKIEDDVEEEKEEEEVEVKIETKNDQTNENNEKINQLEKENLQLKAEIEKLTTDREKFFEKNTPAMAELKIRSKNYWLKMNR